MSALSSLPADLRAVTCLSSAAAADANDDESNNEEDSSTTNPVYPSLQFCASHYTDRIYLYTKVTQPVPEWDCTYGISARLGSGAKECPKDCPWLPFYS